MKNIHFLLLTLMLTITVSSQAGGTRKAREATQAELDATCEVTRQEKIGHARAEYIEECVETKQRADRASCERFYADYGNASANRAPLFYDIPECIEAHDFRRSYRNSGK
jgi:hypothetical protein